MQETNNRENWRYQVIPEVRIDREAVKFVSQKLKIPEDLVRKMHDHQWQLVFDFLETGRTVFIPGMFRTLIRVDYLKVMINKLDKEKKRVDGFILSTRKRIERNKKTNARESRIIQHEQKLAGLIERNNELLAQIKDIQDQILARTSVALKPSREEYHENKIKEENKNRKVRRNKQKSKE